MSGRFTQGLPYTNKTLVYKMIYSKTLVQLLAEVSIPLYDYRLAGRYDDVAGETMDIIVFVDRTTIIIIGPSSSRFATYSNNSARRREKQTSRSVLL